MDFEQLYTTYFRKVYGFALSLSRNAHMAEEITQETFYRVLRNPDAFEGRSSVDTYLCSIAHHQYVSMLRRQKHIDFRTDTAQSVRPWRHGGSAGGPRYRAAAVSAASQAGRAV